MKLIKLVNIKFHQLLTKMSMPNIRATILDILGIDRYEFIKSAISRFYTAIEHSSFFLEATALIELQKLRRQKTSKKEI
jgi:DNA-directed RNA polymerase delta subunit